MKVQLDTRRLRPLMVPGAMLLGSALLWLAGVPLVEQRHAESAGVVNRLRAELSTLRGGTAQSQSEAQQLRQLLPQYQKIEAEGLTRPQDRLAAIRAAERLGPVHQLNRLQITLGPEATVDGPAFRQGDVVAVATDITLETGGLLDSHLVDYIRAVQHEIAGRTQVTRLALEKERPIPESAEFDPKGLSEIYVRGTVVLNWRSIRVPPAPAEAK